MNTSIKTRAAALVASILVTATTVFMVAGYAYPEPQAVLLASAQR
jgi:uncharacterized membrane protein